MKRLLIVCVVLAMVFASAQDYNVPFRPRAAGGTFCTDGVFTNGANGEICDEFNSDGSPPTGWTAEVAQTWTAASGLLTAPNAGSIGNALRYSGIETGGQTQYGIVKIDNESGNMGIMLRAEAGGGQYHAEFRNIQSSGFIVWLIRKYDGTTYGNSGTCTVPVVSGDYVMASITGTNETNTVAKVWVTATAPTAAPSANPTCTFTVGTGCEFVSPATTCACLINAGCGDATTTSPAGTYVGLNASAAASQTFDNFAGGGS
jgi:hypothetical protein